MGGRNSRHRGQENGRAAPQLDRGASLQGMTSEPGTKDAVDKLGKKLERMNHENSYENSYEAMHNDVRFGVTVWWQDLTGGPPPGGYSRQTVAPGLATPFKQLPYGYQHRVCAARTELVVCGVFCAESWTPDIADEQSTIQVGDILRAGIWFPYDSYVGVLNEEREHEQVHALSTAALAGTSVKHFITIFLASASCTALVRSSKRIFAARGCEEPLMRA
eukprot:gnl/TRDRNA2_/TRDRNA2_175287_c0_seq1.p1 gnl/TRDRNA2_/TRDRNA2_175287_c0~~gnl/TRDRNA2_/TRDRNA2_175287_c0_seq1.p1  ORF type:complete len:219 (+),score=9.81 gnl/TRDRNA2_/TRDRNA2_175287_c0_seq1:30-686(+)